MHEDPSPLDILVWHVLKPFFVQLCTVVVIGDDLKSVIACKHAIVCYKSRSDIFKPQIGTKF